MLCICVLTESDNLTENVEPLNTGSISLIIPGVNQLLAELLFIEESDILIVLLNLHYFHLLK